MMILEPIAHETLWGGRTLARYFRGQHEKIGHMYSLFDSAEGSNRILNGEHAGMPFHEYYLQQRERMGLGGYGHFPLVLAIVEAAEHLSLQVHPGDEAARELEGAESGKNESWYFLRRPASGWIYNGTNCASVQEAGQMLAEGRAMEIAARMDVQEGDYVYVAAGTLHAMTAGSLVYEIEENAEYTYRFYDFDRRDAQGNLRPLHTEKALRALDPGRKSVARKYGAGGIAERRYTTELLPSLAGYENRSSTWECITLLEDPGDELCDGMRAGFGMTIVLEPGERLPLAIGKAMLARPTV